jgi:hypothetical protein
MNLGNQSNLGHLLGEFGWNKGRAKALLWLWIFLLFPSLLFSFVLIGIPGLILSIHFIRRSIIRLRATQPAFLVYEQGAIDQRQQPARVIRYEDIKNVYISAIVTNGVLNYVVTLEPFKGEKIKIDEHVANIENLKTLLEEQIVRQQLPVAIAAYQQGQPITFDFIQITPAGISRRKNLLPWAEFESATIERSYKSVYLTIRQKGNSESWGIEARDSFPNLGLFFALIHYIQQAQTAS